MFQYFSKETLLLTFLFKNPLSVRCSWHHCKAYLMQTQYLPFYLNICEIEYKFKSRYAKKIYISLYVHKSSTCYDLTLLNKYTNAFCAFVEGTTV
jgi:hypothetical protein